MNFSPAALMVFLMRTSARNFQTKRGASRCLEMLTFRRYGRAGGKVDVSRNNVLMARTVKRVRMSRNAMVPSVVEVEWGLQLN